MTESEIERLKNIVENMPGAGLITYATGKGDGRIVCVNRILLDMFGCEDYDDLMDFCGGTISGLIYSDDISSAIWSMRTRARNLFDIKDSGVSAEEDLAEDSLTENIAKTHYRVQTKTGRMITVTDLLRYIRMDNGSMLACCILIPSEYNYGKKGRDSLTGLSTLRMFINEADKFSNDEKISHRLAYIFQYRRFQQIQHAPRA
ncbi:MAG: hypothetical protein ACI4LM_02555 [Anaerovoracaceae bacterium]